MASASSHKVVRHTAIFPVYGDSIKCGGFFLKNTCAKIISRNIVRAFRFEPEASG